MAAKIFKNAMTVGLAVFLLSVALFMGVLYQYFGDQLTRELATEATMVAQGVDGPGLLKRPTGIQPGDLGGPGRHRAV